MQLKKLLLSLAIAGYALSASAQSADLSVPYSGFGNMPIGMALGSVLPKGTGWDLKGVTPEENVKWNVPNGTVTDALNAIASSDKLQWEIVNSQVVFSHAPKGAVKKTTAAKALAPVAANKTLAVNETIVTEVAIIPVIRRTETLQIIRPGEGVPAVAPPPLVTFEEVVVEKETITTAGAPSTTTTVATPYNGTPSAPVIQSEVIGLQLQVNQLQSQVDDLKKALATKPPIKATPVSTPKPAVKTPSKKVTVIGATSTSLVLEIGKNQTETVEIGGLLPDGSTFQGYDGKQIKTSKGFYLVK